MAVTTRVKPLLRQGFLYNVGMPTYLYVCENGHEYEETRGMSEEPKRTICDMSDCGTKLVRKFTAPTISFKGTGFNTTRG